MQILFLFRYVISFVLITLFLASCGSTDNNIGSDINSSTYDSMSSDTNNNVNTSKDANTQKNMQSTSGPIAVISVNGGVIEVQLDLQNAPNTSKNFIDLVNKKFYDGLTFHRVIPGFVAQGGDPKGDGTGGSDKTIDLEIKCEDGKMIKGKVADCVPMLKHKEGVIAMARSMDPNSASSQFYITLAQQPSLDGQYAVFGEVISGMDVVKEIKVGDIITSIRMK